MGKQGESHSQNTAGCASEEKREMRVSMEVRPAVKALCRVLDLRLCSVGDTEPERRFQQRESNGQTGIFVLRIINSGSLSMSLFLKN